jgi:hypothetical protein
MIWHDYLREWHIASEDDVATVLPLDLKTQFEKC